MYKPPSMPAAPSGVLPRTNPAPQPAPRPSGAVLPPFQVSRKIGSSSGGGVQSELVFEVEIDYKALSDLNTLSVITTMKKLPFDEKSIHNDLINYVVIPVEYQLDTLISGYAMGEGIAPKDTGRLRWNLMNSYKGPHSHNRGGGSISLFGNPIDIYLGAQTVPYGPTIADPPTGWNVTHTRQMQVKSYRKGRPGWNTEPEYIGPRGGVYHIKNDPHAQLDWYPRLMRQARDLYLTFFNRYVSVILQPLLLSVGVPMYQMQQFIMSLLHWRFQ